MRIVLRFAGVLLLLLAGWAAPPRLALAANLDTTADQVLGQTDFTNNSVNKGGLSATSLNHPVTVALDAHGNLYVADTFNNRVLEYDAPLTTHAAASRVFGQPDFNQNAANGGAGPTATSLNAPFGLAVDAQGNLYVADSSNQRVLEYDAPLSSGMAASRVFGQGGSFITAGINQGGVSANSLASPGAVALDAQGNLYVADGNNSRVLEYDAPLTTDTTADRVIGQPDFTHGNANNGGLSANSLQNPQGVALDAQGSLYVADTNDNRVLEYDAPLTTHAAANRVIGQPNFITNTANNGGVNANGLYGPIGVALDAQGNLYVADSNNSRVLEYDSPLATHAAASRVFGQGGNFTTNLPNNGGISANSLLYASGVALDAQGNLYVADIANNRVLEYDVPVPYGVPAVAALSPSTVAAGSPAFTLTVNGSGFVPGSSVRWNGSSRPTTYLNSTQLNASIAAADLAGGGPFAVTVFTPAPGGGLSSLINLSLYARVGRDVTADVVQGQPNFMAGAGNNPLMPPAHSLSRPNGVAVDGRSGRLFVADENNNRVLGWPNAPAFANGQPADLVLGQANFLSHNSNKGGVNANSLSSPSRMALDAQGNLYVSDSGNNRVLEYDAPLSSGMAASRVFGQGGNFVSALSNNGGVSANSLDGPFAVALDAQGNLYVADTFNNRVLEYDTPLSSGTAADHVFGQPDFTQNTANNGGAGANSLASPNSVALDAQGNLYVADQGNNRVLEYNSPLSTDTTADHVFGQPDFTQTANNNGGVSANSLNTPGGLVLDEQGNLYVADTFNSRMLEYDAPLTTDRMADRVFGQPDFTHNTVNNGGLSANSLHDPLGLALDARGNLYVGDFANNRVLEFDWALAKIYLPLVLR